MGPKSVGQVVPGWDALQSLPICSQVESLTTRRSVGSNRKSLMHWSTDRGACMGTLGAESARRCSGAITNAAGRCAAAAGAGGEAEDGAGDDASAVDEDFGFCLVNLSAS